MQQNNKTNRAFWRYLQPILGVLFSLLSVESNAAASATAYLVTNSESANITKLHIVNSSSSTQQFTGTLYNGDGVQQGAASQALHSGSLASQQRVILNTVELENIFGVSAWSGPAMLEVTGQDSFDLMSKLTSPSGLVSNTNCVRSDGIHNIEGFENSAITYVRFINTGTSTISNITGTLYDAAGTAIGTAGTQLLSSLASKEAVWLNRNQLSSLVGSEWDGEASLILDSPSSDLKLLNLNFINGETFFNFSCYEDSTSKTAYLMTNSASANVSSLHIINTSSSAQQYTGSLYNGDGDQLGSAEQSLHTTAIEADGRLQLTAVELETLFGVSSWSGPAVLEVQNDSSFDLMIKLTSPSGLVSNTNCVRSDDVQNIEGFENSAMTYVRFINTSTSTISNISGTLYDSTGTAIGTASTQLLDSLASKEAVWLNRNQLSSLVGSEWTGEASLVLDSTNSDLKLLNLNFVNEETFFNFSCYENSDASSATSTGLYDIVDTNQTTCYKSGLGSATTCSGTGYDADYSGNQSSYTVSGDGLTVLDNVTGLTWTQTPDLDGAGTIDVNAKKLPDPAVSYCESLDLGGRSDWRLPTIKEQYSLMQFTGRDPSSYTGSDTSELTPFIDDSVFGVGFGDTSANERIIDGQYATTSIYTSTTMNGNETMFGVNFVDGRIKGYPTSSDFYVFCVAGNTSYGDNSFTDNGDTTISDTATGLMWQQQDYQSTNFEDAISYCETASTASHTDWRLPDVKELHSLVDYSRSPDFSSSAAIDPIFTTTSFTNEGGYEDWGSYWSSTTHVNFNEEGTAAAYVSFGESLGYFSDVVQDVHGAGAQRSDNKVSPSNVGGANTLDAGFGTFYYHGPQGDILRNDNFVRCVRNVDG